MEMSEGYRRSFDTSFEAHQGLLHKFARKGYGRLTQAGVSVDYEDVFQEMSLTYVKAVKNFKPEMGYSFSAYLGQAIWHEFNRVAEAEIAHRLKINSIEDASDGTDADEGDLYEVIESDAASPERYLEVKQDWVTNSRRCGSVARLIVKQIINPDKGILEFLKSKQQANREIDVTLIGQYHKIDREAMKMAKRNLNNVYGKCFR